VQASGSIKDNFQQTCKVPSLLAELSICSPLSTAVAIFSAVAPELLLTSTLLTVGSADDAASAAGDFGLCGFCVMLE